MINIAFRLDDPSPASDAALESRIIEIFVRHGLPLTIGVIPFSVRDNSVVEVSEENIRHLIAPARQGFVEIALHGYLHTRRDSSEDQRPTEFAGLSVERQSTMICEAQNVLRKALGSEVSGFIPPFNSYDSNTLKALLACGFRYVSGSVAGGGVKNRRIQSLPASVSMRSFRSVLHDVLRFCNWSPVVIVYFHPDDFFEFRDPPAAGDRGPFMSLEDLDYLLRQIAQNNLMQAVTLSQLASSMEADGSGLVAVEYRHTKFLPWRMRREVPRQLLFRSRSKALAVGLGAPFAYFMSGWRGRAKRLCE